LISPAQTFNGIDQAGKASSALFLKAFPTRKKLNKTLDAFSFYPENINPVYKNQFYLGNKYAKSDSSFLQLQPFSNEDLKKITIPVLVLIGDHDIINSEQTLTLANKYLPNCKTQTIKNAGHFLSIDQSQTVNKVVLDFLK
jgi:pimeloyl-ACP methyl ester carboxylesterase